MDLEQPVKDFPLLWKVYDHIVAHPEEWHQAYWATKRDSTVCGTAYCFAGHAVMMSEPTAEPDWASWWSDDQTPLVKINGEVDSFHTVAKRALGLNETEAEYLFDANNTLSEIHGHILEWEHTDLLN